MADKIIKKCNLSDFLDRLIQDYVVFAPVKNNGLIVFHEISSGNEALLDYRNSKISPKGLFFPQSEILFHYKSDQNKINVEAPAESSKPRLIFGIRPCDARAIVALDSVFDGTAYKDPYYLLRRNKTLVVSIGCVKPAVTCFCRSVGGSPFSREGSDLQFVDIGDEYLIKACTERGAKLMVDSGLENAGKSQLNQAERLIKNAEESMPPVIELEGLKDKLDNASSDSVWQKLSEKCIGCGVCTYLCPTCHCFDIVDEAKDSSGKRMRTWDSCQFPLFTLQTSGVNPRPTVKERYHQRIMHKFSYFIDGYGKIGCVGCGRCVAECPVNLDIRQTLNTIVHLERVK